MREFICIVCGGKLVEARIPALLVCEACRFVTANVALSRQEIEALYSASYFAGEEYHDYLSERPLIERNFRARLKTLLRYIGAPSEKNLFEIGAAYGFFLSVAQEHFASVKGVDISIDAATFAIRNLGLDVRAGDFLDLPLDGAIDVACLWDTVEHLQDPHLYLERLSKHMQPGGILAITTGDMESAIARLRGAKWRQIHPPSHLHYFSRRTLSDLLGKCGFSVRYCGYEGMFRSLDTIAYIILNIKHQQPTFYSWLKKSGLLKLNIYLNLYDIMFVIAEKL